MTKSNSNNEHALLSPSGAAKWLPCAAALLMEKDFPNTSGEAAILGTAMHSFAEEYLNGYIMHRGRGRPWEVFEGLYVSDYGRGGVANQVNPQPHHVLITKDMVDQVRKYAEYCTPIIDSAEYVKLEMRAELSKVLHPGYADREGEPVKTFGTADLVAVVKRTDGSHMLIIGDLKTGRHKVEAKENKQLMLYALGVMRRMRRMYDISIVRLAIFQPYCGGASEHDITPDALDIFAKYAQKRSIKALDVYFAGKKNLKSIDFGPSEKGCKWCRFSEKCNARAKSVVSDLDIGGGPDAKPTPELEKSAESHEMTLEQLKTEYDRLPELRQHIEKIEKAVYSALSRGEKVPGLKLVEGKPGPRKWYDAESVEQIMVKARLKRELIFKETLISPTEAEKVLASEKPRLWKRLESQIKRSEGKASVADINDNRPEYKAASDGDLE